MAVAKYENIYKLLATYDFHINTNLHADLTCVICNRILNKAHQSPCGCRYCHSCITDYLKSNNKSCPGKTDDCQDQTINDNDLQFDHVANRKISTLKVNCPVKSCTFIDELKNMAEHMESHEMGCPFLDIGCNNLLIKNHLMKDHLIDESYSHAIILMDSMKNMKNEIEIIKEDSQKKDDIIDKLQHELIWLKQENSKEMKILKNEIKKLKNERSNNSVRETSSFGLVNYSTTNLPEERIDISDNESCSNAGDSGRNRCISSSSSIRSHSESHEFAPFQWKINDFLKRRKEAISKFSRNIYSKPFYSHKNGYKLRLRVNPNGFGSVENTHLSVFFSIINGEHDDTLFWPMQRQVTIALIDQISGEIFISEKYGLTFIDKDFAVIFHKPSNRKENGDYYYYGTPNFIELNRLIKNRNLIKKGSILLKCFVD